MPKRFRTRHAVLTNEGCDKQKNDKKPRHEFAT